MLLYKWNKQQISQKHLIYLIPIENIVPVVMLLKIGENRGLSTEHNKRLSLNENNLSFESQNCGQAINLSVDTECFASSDVIQGTGERKRYEMFEDNPEEGDQVELFGDILVNAVVGIVAVALTAVALVALAGISGPVLIGAVIGGTVAVGALVINDGIEGNCSAMGKYVCKGASGAVIPGKIEATTGGTITSEILICFMLELMATLFLEEKGIIVQVVEEILLVAESIFNILFFFMVGKKLCISLSAFIFYWLMGIIVIFVGAATIWVVFNWM